jgi:parallel beta-helix repeat protein
MRHIICPIIRPILRPIHRRIDFMPTRRSTLRRTLWGGGLIVLLLAPLVAATVFLGQSNIAPRRLAPYLEKRASGHNSLIVEGTALASTYLVSQDRMDMSPDDLPLATLAGARFDAAPPPPGRVIRTEAELQDAVKNALPGDVLVLAEGRLTVARPLRMTAAGTAERPIRVTALIPGRTTVELANGEGFQVAAPHWHFDNLNIRGACGKAYFCEHAFHVVGKGSGFVLRNSDVRNFNSHLKINGADGHFPDQGLVEWTTLTNDSVRPTDHAVTAFDLVAANGWVVRHTLISDFIKGMGDHISYGAFAKGGGQDNRFEQNVVICEHRLRGQRGQRVGLSLGGGGTAAPYCRDRRCVTEHARGTLAANIVMSCSDDGIYLNNAAQSRVLDNTVIDTAGISVRFAGSSADLDGNLVDGPIHSRNGGVLRMGDNMTRSAALAYLGYHPARALFVNAHRGDLRWAGAAPERAEPAPARVQMCSAEPGTARVYGAFQDVSACLRAKQQ